jgi:hypothetical protein
MTTAVAWILLAAAALLNLFATTELLRSDLETRTQKILQLLLIWLLPIIGVILVIAVRSQTLNTPKPRPGSDATGLSLQPGSDGDLNRHSANDSNSWSDGHGGGGHSGD